MSVIISGTDGLTFNDTSLQGAAASPYVLKNRIINGAMVIDQRYAGASVTPTSDGQYTLDRWSAQNSVASKYSVQQVTTAPAGFANSLKVTSLSAYTVGSAEAFGIIQYVEGYNVADLGWGTANAKTVTLSAWVQSSLTGTFGGSIYNSALNRSYPFSYSIPVANTWTQISITIAGDTSGTWLTTNGRGLSIDFSIGMGSTLSNTAGSWYSGLYLSATGATSVVGTSGATFYITGVQLEIGSTATPFERRLYNQELANCQRYYYRVNKESLISKVISTGGAYYSTTACYATVPFLVSMRSLPSLTTGTVASFSIFSNGTGRACSAIVIGNTTLEVALLNCTTSAATSGNAGWLESNSGTNSYLEFNSEL